MPDPEDAPNKRDEAPSAPATPRSRATGARQATEPRTPSLGLALGGGAARGWAHIGAVRRLAEIGLKPDVVSGTSIGALVGGFWLAGSLDALEAWARSLTKRRMLSYFDLMLNGAGLMGGKRLERTMLRYLGERKIEDLPAHYVAVTAEMETGHETWLMEGSLSQAIQAAYALPGVFPPRQISGRWLIDGALVNPLPVSACRAFGARLVIAVGLHTDAFGRAAVNRRTVAAPVDEPVSGGHGTIAERVSAASKRRLLERFTQSSDAAPGLGSVMMASLNIVMDRITRARLAGDPPDVLILPRVGHIPLLDFDNADELIAHGAAAVDAALPAIEQALDHLT